MRHFTRLIAIFFSIVAVSTPATAAVQTSDFSWNVEPGKTHKITLTPRYNDRIYDIYITNKGSSNVSLDWKADECDSRESVAPNSTRAFDAEVPRGDIQKFFISACSGTAAEGSAKIVSYIKP